MKTFTLTMKPKDGSLGYTLTLPAEDKSHAIAQARRMEPSSIVKRCAEEKKKRT